jgi:agmatine deiminase
MEMAHHSPGSRPAADGCRMPGEFEPHAATWLIWPERPDIWRERAAPVQAAFVALATAIAGCEPVRVGVSPGQLARARAALPATVQVLAMPNNDAWVRDTGPTFLLDSQGLRRGVDWRFNAWGGLYADWRRDAAVARRVLAFEGARRYRAPMVNEGGAIHSDGEGTLMVTEQCLLNPNRNPRLVRERIEGLLKDYTGARQVIWLGKGVVNDETGGHVDNLACFARPGVVLLTWSDNPRDLQHRVSRDALERLRAARDAHGRRLQVHKLPSPGPLTMTAREARGIARRDGTRTVRGGLRLAGSYANFYLCNGAVIAPLLDVRTDAAALRVLRRVFPRRRVVGIPARELLLGGGNIHCLTQQVPAEQPVRAVRRGARP